MLLSQSRLKAQSVGSPGKHRCNFALAYLMFAGQTFRLAFNRCRKVTSFRLSPMAQATVVRIREVAGSAPIIEVISAPFGYNIYVGPLVTNPEVEQGALINILG